MIKVTVIFPSDPFGSKVGGAEVYINDFIKFAPLDFEIDFIGITSNRAERPVRKWKKLSIGKKAFNFYPIFFERNEDKKTIIPLSLRFSLVLRVIRLNLSGRVILFNRIEPALLLTHVKSPKLAIIHNDIREQLKSRNSEVLWSRLPWLYFKIEDSIFRSLEHIYSVSKSTIDFYKSRFPQLKEKFSFLPTWVDTSLFYPTIEPKIGIRKRMNRAFGSLPVDKKWILFVGRLQQQKAPRRLVDTFFTCNQNNRDSCLIICGDGNLKDDVEKYVRKLKLEKDVFFLGNVDRTELTDIYRAADCLLLVSNFEGMPLSVLEAAACGLPVVTTDVGEVRRIVKNGFSGEVVENFNPGDIARAIEKVISNPHIYSKENCLNSVVDYKPEKILTQVYEMIRTMNNQYYK